MIHSLSYNKCTVLACFNYSSVVQDGIAEFIKTYDIHKDRNNPNKWLEDVYNDLAIIAEKQYGKPLKDNKTVLLFEYEGREFFIGYYDNKYTIGLACYVFIAKIVDFQCGVRTSIYISDAIFNNSADIRSIFDKQNNLIYKGA